MLFPLQFRPKEDYHKGKGHKRWFGAPRTSVRKHAGCDLFAPEGTAILAVEDGTVLRYNAKFYHGTGALEVDHEVFIVRYCEISPRLPAGMNFKPGSPVLRGQVIAYVGKMTGGSHMLHFEMYLGTETGPLTDRKKTGGPFQRRKDLLDPTPYLDTAVLDSGGGVEALPTFIGPGSVIRRA